MVSITSFKILFFFLTLTVLAVNIVEGSPYPYPCQGASGCTLCLCRCGVQGYLPEECHERCKC